MGMGVQGDRGLCSPPVRSDKEYFMLVYSRPLILLFCWQEKRKKRGEAWPRKTRQEKKCVTVALLLLLTLIRLY